MPVFWIQICSIWRIFSRQNTTSELTWSRMYLDICHCSQTFSTLISINNRKWLFSSQNLTDLLFVELSYVLQDFSFLPLAYSKVFQQNLIEMKLGHCFVLFFQCLPFLKNGIWMVKFLESSYILSTVWKKHCFFTKACTIVNLYYFTCKVSQNSELIKD